MSKLKIAVLVSGSGSNLQALIDAVSSGKINGSIQIVISDKEEAYALERARSSAIKAVCINRKTAKSKTDFELELLQCINEEQPELIILAGFLSILPSELVKQYQGKIINIHPSLIPAFCGKGFYGERVHQAVIEYGAKVSGATVHFVDEGTDTGPIILQRAIGVEDSDNAAALAHKVLDIEHQLLTEAAALFCNGRLIIEGRKVRIL